MGGTFCVVCNVLSFVVHEFVRRTRSDEILLLGIARHAEPFDHLQNRHRDFQKRMMTTVGAPTAESEPSPPMQYPSSTTSIPRRTVLGSVPVPSSSSASSRRSGTTGRTGAGPASSDTTDVFSTPAPPARSASSSNNGRRLVIFDDAEVAPGRAAGNAWSTLEPRKTRIKENVRDVEKMGGTVMKPKGGNAKRVAEAKKKSASSAKGKLVIFSDEDEDAEPVGSSTAAPMKPPAASSKKPGSPFTLFEEVAEEQTPLVVPATPKFELFTDDEVQNTSMSGASSSSSLAPGSVMRAKAVQPGLASSEAEALRRDPFKNYAKDD